MKHLWILVFLPLILALAPAQSGPPALPACSAAVHDSYKALGPDGAYYPTWHPQIDVTHGCVFNHEHGSDPALFRPGWHPLFGYSARAMPEGHAGFKGVAFQANGYRWYVTEHQGSANATLAACTRYHTFDLAIASEVAVLADVHTMADFGRSEQNVGAIPLQTACANQAAIPRNGVRQFPTKTSGDVGYEPWAASLPGNVIGLNAAGFTLNVKNAQTACDTITCTVSLPRTDPANLNGPALGTWREVSVAAGFGITATPAYSGTFTTNMDATGPGDTMQYIQPGLNAHTTTFLACKAWNAFAYIYDCTGALWDESPFRHNMFVTGAN